MTMATMRRVLFVGGIALLALLMLARLLGTAAPAASQTASLEERVQQLERRLAAAEARLAALEAVVPAAPPASSAEVAAYRTEFSAIVQAYAAYRQRVAAAVATRASAAELQTLADEGTVLYPALALRIRTLIPPPCYAAAHAFLLQAANQLEVAAIFGVGTATTSMTESILAATIQQAQQAFAGARC
jgi:uncharacterized coiled-coil protein SlyX